MGYRIAQISDTHLSRDKPFFVANFDRVARHINARRPDLVVHTGDLTLDGSRQEEDLVEALRLHEALDPPIRFIPGNHDIGENADAPVGGLACISAESRARYVRLFGPDYWQLDVPGWRIVAIDAQLLGSELPAAAEQLEFVSAAVTAAGAGSIALLVHKPLYHLSPEETAITGRFVNPEARRDLFEAFGERAPRLVASGHVHQYFSNRSEDGGQHVWAPSSGFILPDSRQPLYGRKDVGYVEHQLMPDGTHISEFVAVPELARLVITDFPDGYGDLL